jgi:hypothetical protein
MTRDGITITKMGLIQMAVTISSSSSWTKKSTKQAHHLQKYQKNVFFESLGDGLFRCNDGITREL